MKKIVLDVKDENIDTVLNILQNLKDGLIDNIQSDAKKLQSVKYTPKAQQVVREGAMPGGKYLSREEYQRRRLKS